MRVRRSGQSFAHPLLVLVLGDGGKSNSRFAVTAGVSIGNAVQRNRAKRILREKLRPMLPGISVGWDVILLARKPFLKASDNELKNALTSLLSQANLLEKSL